MSISFVATSLRTTGLMHAARQTEAALSMQKTMTGFLVTSALAPLTALKPKKTRRRKPPTSRTGRSLGDVVKQLETAKSCSPGLVTRPTRRKVRPRIPKDAHYLARTHRSTAGMRGFKLYLPASQPKRPKGLILMLHGCNQTPDDFAVGTHMNALAEKHGLAVAYPAQTRGHNATSGWNWFHPAHQIRGVGEPAILASLTRKLMRELDLDRDAVFVAGLSAGGAMAVILADLYPDVYSAVGVHSGLARGSARGVISAMRTMRRGGASGGIPPTLTAHLRPVRRIVFQGSADSTVHPSNAAMIVSAAVGDEAAPTRIGKRSAAGRGYTRSEYTGSDGATLVEHWLIEGAGHAWSGGREAISYADRKGPDASAHMVRFFLAKSV